MFLTTKSLEFFNFFLQIFQNFFNENLSDGVFEKIFLKIKEKLSNRSPQITNFNLPVNFAHFQSAESEVKSKEDVQTAGFHFFQLTDKAFDSAEVALDESDLPASRFGKESMLSSRQPQSGQFSAK